MMFPLVDDLPMKFFHKLRASAASIVSRDESLLLSVLAYLFATQPTNKYGDFMYHAEI